MAAPFSTRFIGAAIPTGSTGLIYTFPSGFVGVVRSISIANTSAGPSDIQVARPGTFILYSIHQMPGTSFSHLDTRDVMNAGEQLQVLSTAAGCFALISGYLLNSS